MCGWAAGFGRKATISESKFYLRELGGEGPKLATRLGKLSKLRNTEVHDENRAFISDLAQTCGFEPGMYSSVVAASSPAPSTIDFFELSVAEVVEMQETVAKEHEDENNSFAQRMADLTATDSTDSIDKLRHD